MIAELFTLGMLAATIRISTPLLLAALGTAFSLKANIFNIAIEGFMLIGAFLAVVLTSQLDNLVLSLGLTLLITTAIGLLYGYVTITLGSDQIIAGLGFNLLAVGFTNWMLQSVLNSPGGFMDLSAKRLPTIDIPFLENIPLLNTIFNGQDILTIGSWLLVIISYLFMHQSGNGLKIRATGEHELAAKTTGINTIYWKYFSSGITGLFCGLAGASISLSHLGMFSQGMTAGRGFIAFVAATFASGNIIGTTLMALLFGFFGSIAIRLEGFGFPTQFVQMIPYLVTLVALVLAKRKNKI